MTEAQTGRGGPTRLERGRGFGDVWLGWTLWRALQLDTVCAERMAGGREAGAWSTMAAILTIARLCEPSSELHIAEDWYRRNGLEDLLGVPADQVNETGSTARSITYCRTRPRSSSTSGSGWETCSRSTTTCSCTT